MGQQEVGKQDRRKKTGEEVERTERKIMTKRGGAEESEGCNLFLDLVVVRRVQPAHLPTPRVNFRNQLDANLNQL